MSRVRRLRPCREVGNVDTLFLLVPTVLVATIILGLFQYGQTTNSLALSADMVSRQIARHPGSLNLISLTGNIIQKENLPIKDFHVLRFPVGNRVFIQLVLVGEEKKIWWMRVTPSARSLVVEDKW